MNKRAKKGVNNTKKEISKILKQGRMHGYLSCVRLGRGSNESLQALKQQNTELKVDVTDGQNRCN